MRDSDTEWPRRWQTYLALLLVAALFIARATLAMLVVPRWQGPDEPQHFLLIAAEAAGRTHDGRAPVGLEAAIIRSMARHGWWTYYGAETPSEPLPTTFLDGPGLVSGFGGASGGSRLYAVATAPVIRAMGNGVERQYDLLRKLSTGWALLTVLIAYAATKPWLGTTGAIAVSGSLAYHPQFVLVATNVGPDAFVSFCGGVVWWMGVRALTGHQMPASIAGLWIAALAAALTRRLGTPLIGVAAMISVVSLYRVRRIQTVQRRSLGVVAMAIAGTILVLWVISPNDLVRTVTYFFEPIHLLQSRATPDVGRFWWSFWQSAWLYGGWLRLPPPDWWMLAVSMWAIAAFGGVVILLRREQNQTLLRCCLGVVVVQVAAIYVSYFWVVGTGAQGRYLFPVIVPFLSLLAAGTKSIAEKITGSGSFAYAVALMMMFDLLGWTIVLIPSYA